MDFNKDRFLSFARYDLTINKTFYRNLSLVAIIGTVGLTIMFFFFRLYMWKEMYVEMYADNDHVYSSDLGYAHYNSMFMTSIVLLEFLCVVWVVFAGCWAHNLRNKQSRIIELTLPVSNIEKYLWHTGLMVGGGALLCLASLLLADGVNAIFTLLMTPAENGVASVTASVFDIIGMNIENWKLGFPTGTDEDVRSVFHFISFFMICAMLCNTMIYLFGNSVKYKYNIILTYIVLYAIGIVVSIVVSIGMAFIASTNVPGGTLFDVSNPELAVKWFFGIGGFIALALSVVLPVWSYKRYKKAQITSHLNK